MRVLRFRRNGDPDAMIGRRVEIRSQGGVAYRGIVKAVERAGGETGELFDLDAYENPGYEHFVYVTNRHAQIREIEREA